MKHCPWFYRSFLAAFAFVWLLGGALRAAHAAPTVAMRKCELYACNSAESLRAEGRAAAWTLPFDTILFVTSEQYPLSAFVRVCQGPRGGKDACMITYGDLGAVELDNEVYARAAKIAPIDIPADVATSATNAEWELVEEWMFTAGILVATGRNGISPWHNILNPLTWHWLEFEDGRTFELNRVHSKDRITLKFPDGSTAQAEMVGVGGASGHFFRLLPDTIRLPNGELWIESGPPAAAQPVGGGIGVPTPWGGYFAGDLFQWCAFLESHCEYHPSDNELDCYYRRHRFPCG